MAPVEFRAHDGTGNRMPPKAKPAQPLVLRVEISAEQAQLLGPLLAPDAAPAQPAAAPAPTGPTPDMIVERSRLAEREAALQARLAEREAEVQARASELEARERELEQVEATTRASARRRRSPPDSAATGFSCSSQPEKRNRPRRFCASGRCRPVAP